MQRVQDESTRSVVKRLATAFNAMDSFMELYDDDKDPQPDVPSFNPVFSDLSKCSDEEALSAISNIREIKKDLDGISQLLVGRIARIKTARKLEEGFEKLPPEIMAHVFMYGYTPNTAGARYAFKLSKVCQRFRAIALDTPALWATLTNSIPRKLLDLCIARSRNSGITVSVNGNALDSDFRLDMETFLDAIGATCNRWVDFVYFYPDIDEVGAEILTELKQIRSATAGITLPHLRKIHASIDPAVSFGSAFDFSKIFFSTWVTPALTEFSGICVYPCLSTASMLTKCTLVVRNVDARHERIVLLLRNMSNFSNLKDLTFHFRIVDDYEDDTRLADIDLSIIPPFGSLESLSIFHERGDDYSYGWTDFDSAHALKFIFSHLDFPNLSTLRCKLLIEGDSFKEFREVLPSKERCPRLRHLTLIHRHFERQGWESDTITGQGSGGLEVLLFKFPQIHHLEIKAPHMYSPGIAELLNSMSRHSSESLPHLRTLTLHSATAGLARTVAILHQGGLEHVKDWDFSLEKLKITSWALPVDDDVVMGLADILGDKVEYIGT